LKHRLDINVGELSTLMKCWRKIWLRRRSWPSALINCYFDLPKHRAACGCMALNLLSSYLLF